MSRSIAAKQREVRDPSAVPPGSEELFSRRSGGTLVRLYWRPTEDDVLVRVTDEQTTEDFFVELPARHALTVLYEPGALRPPRSESSDGGDPTSSGRTPLFAEEAA